jgi:hypothetical protein
MGRASSLLVVALLWGLACLANPIGVERTPLQINFYPFLKFFNQEHILV